MPWLDDHKAQDGSIRIRLLDRIDRKQVTIVSDLGRFKPFAEDVKTHYRKAKSMGFVFTPPTSVADIENFLKAKREGRDYDIGLRRLPIEEMCDLYLRLHGPSLKGGVSDHYTSAYDGLRLRMGQVKRFWRGKHADEIGKLNVRDYLAQFKTVGTRIRHLVVLGHMFRSFEDWNEEGVPELNGPLRLPKHNPSKQWRKQMKAHEKLELPDTRVLTHEEWSKLWRHLTPRAREICEVALQRFLRIADIKKISHASIVDGQIKGLQEKTGSAFSVPVIGSHSHKYDFTNFHRDFTKAQEVAGLLFPPDHPLHFSVKDLRRTGATWYYNKTKDLRRVQKMLGHRKLSTTERYLHISDVDLAEAAQTMDILAAVNIQP